MKITFDAHGKTAIFTLNFQFLYHKVGYLEQSEIIDVLSSSRFQ